MIYQNHINTLAERLGCKLDVADAFKNNAMMFVEESPARVEVPPATDQINYLINLHELGHVFHGHTQGRPPFSDQKFYFDNGVLHSEAQAWEWALDQCSEEIDLASRMFMWDACLGSYYQHALSLKGAATKLPNGNRHHIEFVYDKPDVYFTSIVSRIQGDLAPGTFTILYEG